MTEISRWWPLLGIAMMRPLGATLLLPIFGPSMLGGTLIRNSMVMLMAFPMLPVLTSTSLPDPIQSPSVYTFLLCSEFAIGLMLGFSAAIPFWAVDAAGFLLDTLRGASMAGVLNPMLGGQSSPLGALFSNILGVLYIVLGGFHAFLSAIYDSYQILVVGVTWRWGVDFIPLLKSQWNLLYNLALTFALPATVMMVLVDLALGLVNRSVQQLNVFSLSMPIKSAITLLMLIISLQFSLSDLISLFESFDGGLMRVLTLER
ncbi:type III secretion system export apparatus subunit SctT [Caballeronia sp. EK]|uniref:type III secretion system export apparatus subunit SctT n=1 Tax=Caballeronia sp. EK TaxID=2767469 RepID=UPI0016558E36|nr:type III secretion system export apparatus subunit SctT [Caballeronia sp. EK]MBC8642782.1 type III secretion system export apparatus subunit SctT [Caballeronia sp. EK]